MTVESLNPVSGQGRFLPRKVEQVDQPVHVVHSRRIEVANEDIGPRVSPPAQKDRFQTGDFSDLSNIRLIVSRPLGRKEANVARANLFQSESKLPIDNGEAVAAVERAFNLKTGCGTGLHSVFR